MTDWIARFIEQMNSLRSALSIFLEKLFSLLLSEVIMLMAGFPVPNFNARCR